MNISFETRMEALIVRIESVVNTTDLSDLLKHAIPEIRQAAFERFTEVDEHVTPIQLMLYGGAELRVCCKDSVTGEYKEFPIGSTSEDTTISDHTKSRIIGFLRTWITLDKTHDRIPDGKEQPDLFVGGEALRTHVSIFVEKNDLAGKPGVLKAIESELVRVGYAGTETAKDIWHQIRATKSNAKRKAHKGA